MAKNQKIKTKFCTWCGHPMKEYFTGRFNENDGTRLIGQRCENVNCEIGCANMGGHFFKEGFLTVSSCKRCGAFPIGYLYG